MSLLPGLHQGVWRISYRILMRVWGVLRVLALKRSSVRFVKGLKEMRRLLHIILIGNIYRSYMLRLGLFNMFELAQTRS